MFYMQDTGNPRFDMARNAAGRRQDTSNQFFSQNWNAPFVGSGTNACGVQPPIVCISNHYVLGNDFDRTTPRMVQYSSTCSARSGATRRSRSATSARAATTSSACSIATMCFRERSPSSGQTALPGVHPGSDDRQRRRSELQLAPSTRRLNNGFSALIGYTLEIRGQRQRHPHAQRRSAVPAEQQLRGG